VRIVVGAWAAAALTLLSSVAGLHAAGAASPTAKPLGSAAPNQITGTLLKIDQSTLTIQTRKGATVLVDDAGAVKAQKVTPLVVGKAFSIEGTYDPRGKLLATIILRAKNSPVAWPDDR
jgi:hypothetical protein